MRDYPLRMRRKAPGEANSLRRIASQGWLCESAVDQHLLEMENVQELGGFVIRLGQIGRDDSGEDNAIKRAGASDTGDSGLKCLDVTKVE